MPSIGRLDRARGDLPLELLRLALLELPPACVWPARRAASARPRRVSALSVLSRVYFSRISCLDFASSSAAFSREMVCSLASMRSSMSSSARMSERSRRHLFWRPASRRCAGGPAGLARAGARLSGWPIGPRQPRPSRSFNSCLKVPSMNSVTAISATSRAIRGVLIIDLGALDRDLGVDQLIAQRRRVELDRRSLPS